MGTEKISGLPDHDSSPAPALLEVRELWAMEFVGPGVCVGGSSGQAHPDVQERVMTGLSMLGAGPVKDLTSLLLSLCQILRGLRTLPWPGTEAQMGSSTHHFTGATSRGTRDQPGRLRGSTLKLLFGPHPLH